MSRAPEQSMNLRDTPPGANANESRWLNSISRQWPADLKAEGDSTQMSLTQGLKLILDSLGRD